MSTPNTPSIPYLLEIIGLQGTAISGLEARIKELEAENESLRRVTPGGPKPPALSDLPHFVKANKPKKEPKDKKQRRQRDQGYARPVAQTPTRTETLAVEECPDCGRALSGGWLHSEREVIDIPQVAVEVIKYLLVGRRCGVCKKRHVPRSREVLSSVAVCDIAISALV